MAKRQQTRRLVSRSFGMGAFLTAIALSAYIIWIGITGQPIPTWFLAISTIF